MAYPGQRYRQRRSFRGERLLNEATSPRGNFELTSPFEEDPLSSYRPPQSTSGTNARSYQPSLDFQSPPHYPHHSVIDRTNRNPAEDLAISCLSHGCCCCQCVRTQEIGFVENCGAFTALVGPGLYCIPWPYSTIAGRVSLRLHQWDFTCETKTRDDVFVRITVNIIYRVYPARAYDAFYSLQDLQATIESNLLDILRSTIPSMQLDHVFTSKTKIKDQVFTTLYALLMNYGYQLTDILINKISPNDHVRSAMNEINAEKRLKFAASHKAEANRIQVIKRAEAEMETKYLEGIGTVREREALLEGMKETVDRWMIDVKVRNPTVQGAMELLLLTQYLDLLTHMGSNELIVEHDPSAVFRFRDSL